MNIRTDPIQGWTKVVVEITPAIICIVPVVFHKGELQETSVRYFVGVKPNDLFEYNAYREDELYTFLKKPFTVSFERYSSAREFADNLANNTGRVVEVMPTAVI